MTEIDQDVWDEGYEAYLDGAERVHCPYDDGTLEHNDWMAGYDCAESDSA